LVFGGHVAVETWVGIAARASIEEILIPLIRFGLALPLHVRGRPQVPLRKRVAVQACGIDWIVEHRVLQSRLRHGQRWTSSSPNLGQRREFDRRIAELRARKAEDLMRA